MIVAKPKATQKKKPVAKSASKAPGRPRRPKIAERPQKKDIEQGGQDAVELSGDSATEQRRKDWEESNEEIRAAFLSLIEKGKGKKPTLDQIAEETGRSAKTVSEHMQTLRYTATTPKYRILTENVLFSIYQTSITGNTAAAKLWMQIVEGWTEKLDLHSTGDGKKKKIIVRLRKPDADV